MKIIAAHNGFLVICIFCLLLTTGWLGPEVSVAQGGNPPESAQNSSRPPKPETNQDPYLFDKLSESEKAQVEKAIEREKSRQNLLHQDEIADRLLLQLKEKQEDIRLYEVILLTIMSLCALMIVLKCMKDSKVCNARDMINGTGLVLVIFSTVMVIIIADAEIQLTAAMGVLGGIAGYLFGTIKTSSQVADKEKIPPEGAAKSPD